MAGIGFELKKMFNKKGFFNKVTSYFYSSIVSIGPFILCMIMITSIQLLLLNLKISFIERELFLATIVYAFIFSQIITSGFSMIVTRFISDRLYEKRYEDILPSLYGIITICIVIGSIFAGVFYFNSPIHWIIKIVSYLLFMELIIMWLQSIYLTALKDYIKIVKSFMWGIGIVVILSFIFLKFIDINKTLGLLISMDTGIFIIIVRLMLDIKSFFRKSNCRYFLFLRYFDKYPELFITNLFYTLAIYVHNFIYWFSTLSVNISDTYIYAPIYDVPVFYAFLSIMPSMVIFVVFVETQFYQKYRNYYNLITGKGNYKDIENARKNMILTLWSEMRNLMEIQLFFTLISLVLGNLFLNRLGLTQFSIEIFNIIVLGAYCNVMILIVILLFLYFEGRKKAVIISILFFITTFSLTFFSLRLEEDYYGVGFFIAAFITLAFAVNRLKVFLDKINYITFCSQPVIFKERKGAFTKLVKKLYY